MADIVATFKDLHLCSNSDREDKVQRPARFLLVADHMVDQSKQVRL